MAGAALAARWLDGVCPAEGIYGDVLFALQICLEELFSNIVLHGGPAPSPLPEIALTVEIDSSRVRLTIADDGKPFDVSKAPAEKVSKPLAELKPGGLGVLLARTFAEKLTYERSGGFNIVTVEFSPPAHGS